MPVTASTGSLFLLSFTALFSIINPLGGAFIFLGATKFMPPQTRTQMARWVAIHSFVILSVSVYIGAYVLRFFGISIPVLRVAGGIVIALSAWQMLNAKDDQEPQREQAAASLPVSANISRMAFYPLTMPITTGPGTISVAVSLGTNLPRRFEDLQWISFLIQMTLATSLVCVLIYFLYRYSDRISRVIGATGTTIVVRLSAFLLFCIGVQVLWNGAAELLRLPTSSY